MNRVQIRLFNHNDITESLSNLLYNSSINVVELKDLLCSTKWSCYELASLMNTITKKYNLLYKGKWVADNVVSDNNYIRVHLKDSSNNILYLSITRD